MSDPTLLPVATTLQTPLLPAYGALTVPTLAAGATYLDPTTGVKVYKLTSAVFPAVAPNGPGGWAHAYAEGGDEISLPHTGATRTVHVYTHDGWHWLFDFTPGGSPVVSNPRMLDGVMKPWTDMAFAFSNTIPLRHIMRISVQGRRLSASTCGP